MIVIVIVLMSIFIIRHRNVVEVLAEHKADLARKNKNGLGIITYFNSFHSTDFFVFYILFC